jgi:hypothetical protein
VHTVGVDVRALDPLDLDWVVEVTRARREALAPHAPRFWRPAVDATERHRDHLGHLIEDPATLGMRTEHGYLLALDRGDHLLVDDFVVTADEHWPTEGVALLEHVRLRPGRLRVVVPAAERARLEAVQEVGLARVETWWHRDLDGVEATASAEGDEGAEVAVDGARGVLRPAPPVYDPGGHVLLVTELESTDALARIEEVAAARGARVSVVSTARSADRDVATLLQCAGYVVTTHFCE